MAVPPNEDVPSIALEGIPHHTDVSGKITVPSSIRFGLHTHFCLFMVPLCLKVPLSDQRVKSGNYFLPLYRVKITYKIVVNLTRLHSGHAEFSVRMFSISHAAKCGHNISLTRALPCRLC